MMQHLQRAVDSVLFIVDVKSPHAKDDGNGIGGHECFGVHLFLGRGCGGGEQEALLFVNFLADPQRFNCGEM